MYGSGGYPRWMTPISLHEAADLQFDESGRVLRVAGDFPLPIPLGTLAQVFVEPLPVKAEPRWETTDTLAVLDEPFSLGPAASFLPAQPYGMSYYGGPLSPRGNTVALVPVARIVRYEIKSTAAGQVTITKRLSLDSHLQFGSEPRLHASGEGEFVLDQETGLLRRAELQCKAVANSESVTRRSSVTLRIKLLEGTERLAALQPPAAPPAKRLSGAEIQKLIEDLKSSDEAARMQAASKLQTSELGEAPPALLDLMTSSLGSEDNQLRMAAVKVIADYGTAEHVPALLQLLKEPDSFNHHTVIRGLGRLKDPRAAEPLAALIASGGSEAHLAVEALGKLGPEAEDAVLPLLKEKHNETRRQACNVLKQIGTKKSLEQLRELMLSTDRMLNEAAAEAVRTIMARQ
jgi:HEAT repeats